MLAHARCELSSGAVLVHAPSGQAARSTVIFQQPLHVHGLRPCNVAFVSTVASRGLAPCLSALVPLRSGYSHATHSPHATRLFCAVLVAGSAGSVFMHV